MPIDASSNLVTMRDCYSTRRADAEQDRLAVVDEVRIHDVERFVDVELFASQPFAKSAAAVVAEVR